MKVWDYRDDEELADMQRDELQIVRGLWGALLFSAAFGFTFWLAVVVLAPYF